MTFYLISFPSPAMDVAEEDFAQVGRDAHAVIQQAKDAGVYVFGGGIDENVPVAMVDADGTVTAATYPQTAAIEGGYTILKLDSRDEAVEWARKIAVACRCSQELRAFQYDPAS
jgi:hypothetical protein